MLEVPESWDIWQGKLQTGCGASRPESVLQSTGLEALKSALTLDLEVQSLEFALVVFGLAWPGISGNVYSVPLNVGSMCAGAHRGFLVRSELAFYQQHKRMIGPWVWVPGVWKGLHLGVASKGEVFCLASWHCYKKHFGIKFWDVGY